MKLAVALSREELNQLQTPVIVEGWDKRKGGRVKRAWLKEFTEFERKRAAALYPMFYKWYLVTGVPEIKIFFPATLDLTRRLVHFFGTVA